MMGLADAGAHVGQILDASQPRSSSPTGWRERGLVPVAEGIRRLTSEPAAFMGIADRGVVAPGMKADLTCSTSMRSGCGSRPSPGTSRPKAGRFVQRADGYAWTLVNGEVLMEAGEHTGTLPGRPLVAT